MDSNISNTMHRKVISLQGGNLKMTVSTKPKVNKPPASDADSLGGTSVARNLFSELENLYLKRRTEIVDSNGFIYTPLHALKKMAEDFKTPLHWEIFKINNSECGSEIWRVEALVGNVRGVGQAPRKILAFQMATLDILEKMKATDKDIQMRLYAFLPGWRTSPAVYNALKEFCMQHGLATPSYKLLKPLPYEEGPQYGVECQIGELIETARSDDRFLAKKLAARQMYDKLSEQPYPDEVVEIGNQCIGLSQLKELGIFALSSSWKKQWMIEHRMVGDSLFTPQDEPDDGEADILEEWMLNTKEGLVTLPDKGIPTGITRVIANDKAIPAAAATDASDMDMETGGGVP